MLVNQFLSESANISPNKTAIWFEDQSYSYAYIESHANRLARALQELGLRKQERVAILLDNSVEIIVSIFAIMKLAGIFVVINAASKARKIEYIIDDSMAQILITDSRHLEEVSKINSQFLRSVICKNRSDDSTIIPIISSGSISISNFDELVSNSPEVYNQNLCIDIDLAGLIYTSGSTGSPKGVMLSHLNIIAASESIIQYLKNNSDDIVLNVLPLSFDYGLYQVFMTFRFNGTLVLERGFLYPYRVIELLRKRNITGFPLVPSLASILLKFNNIKTINFNHLRYITSTGQVLAVPIIKKLCEMFPNTEIYSMYGLTECKRVSYLPPTMILRKPESVGIAMPNVEVFLVDESGTKITDSGKLGELVVRGSNNMQGYWNQPDETDGVLRPGPIPGEKVLYTGDLFRMDEEGFLYFISRKDDIVKIGGERVSPKEVEDLLYKLDEIDEVVVVGIKDEILGYVLKAVVSFKPKSKLSSLELKKFCSEHLENYLVPKVIEIRKNIPKNAHGKIDRSFLSKNNLNDNATQK